MNMNRELLTSSQEQLIENWLQNYSTDRSIAERYEPNYFAFQPKLLISTSKPIKFSIGNGHQLTSSLAQACLEQTEYELVLVTCFWAKSSSKDTISNLLRELSEKALAGNRRIQVRICFSSRSALQKLFQTSSVNGKTYPPGKWKKTLGLPDPRELKGLDLLVKSIFVRPFSVMHPKFVLIDRSRAFMPSCNVSWESWFEGCIEMEGDICNTLYEFWTSFWVGSSARLDSNWAKDFVSKPTITTPEPGTDLDLINVRNFGRGKTIQTILLPSPHRSNPQFSPFSRIPLRPTPLNHFIEEVIDNAKISIYIQTPNLTCRPVIRGLLEAVARGVSVTIVMSSLLMILEQIVTAGTITEFEIWKLRRQYKRMQVTYSKNVDSNLEAHLTKPGDLNIGYYHARSYGDQEKEPVKSHLKLTVVDQEVVVLGSGNLDRASFYTSQELGVAFLNGEFATEVTECMLGATTDRIKWIRD